MQTLFTVKAWSTVANVPIGHLEYQNYNLTKARAASANLCAG